MSTANQFYTYLILDPRQSGHFIYDGGKLSLAYLPIYVGKGKGERCDYHIKEANRLLGKDHSEEWIIYNRTNGEKFITLIDILKEGREPIIIKVLENVTEKEALSKEIELVWVIGRADMNMGTLTNKTWGGEDGGGSPREELTGQKFGMLTVIKFINKDQYSNCNWLCKCECGNEKIIRNSSFKNGKTKSCGCLIIKTAREKMTTHNQTKTSEHNIWVGMKQRGIMVCGRWKDSFENFLGDMGKRPSKNHTLQRKDTNGSFEPSNCVWATRSAVTIDGITKTIKEWSELSGTNYKTIQTRLKRKRPHKEAVFGK